MKYLVLIATMAFAMSSQAKLVVQSVQNFSGGSLHLKAKLISVESAKGETQIKYSFIDESGNKGNLVLGLENWRENFSAVDLSMLVEKYMNSSACDLTLLGYKANELVGIADSINHGYYLIPGGSFKIECR